MRSPWFQASQRSPEQASHRSPDQTSQCSHEQTSQRSPEQTSQRSQQGTLQPTQHNTPVNTPYNTPEPKQKTPDESSIANNNIWKVGTMHTDGRVRIEVIEGMLEPSSKCSNRITNLLHERLEPKGFTWKEVSKETKEFYFEELKICVVELVGDEKELLSWRIGLERMYGSVGLRTGKLLNVKPNLKEKSRIVGVELTRGATLRHTLVVQLLAEQLQLIWQENGKEILAHLICLSICTQRSTIE
ncbi:hypothetical protein POM88_007880 [Heracleum sosnowskyi]|uniref:Uncharacterized protein n=1 Tax=Heracleum sosnowskyi TaxID=360622 RepID=A0AAD8J5D8_9APIA|nr:hypothetical protein POM88_007880 [Heracleum sosnowskyi]